jgi:MoxR-like ATPase
MSLSEYAAKHPSSPIVSRTLVDGYYNTSVDRKAPPDVHNLFVDIMGLKIRVNPAVSRDACLPLPDSYTFPGIPETVEGQGCLYNDMVEGTIALANGRSLYIWGLPGTGKDAFVHAFSAKTRKPAMIYTINPGADIMSWFFTRSFSQAGTSWERGDLLRALVDGYKSEIDGRVYPYLILISDFDRATKVQAESLRLILDSIEGRLVGPTGELHKVLPGTHFVFTANSSGGGDTRGRCISSNVMDASIMDRIQRKVKFSLMSWVDEEILLRKKFPTFAARYPDAVEILGKAVDKLRREVSNSRLHAEFSHRALCAVVGHIEDVSSVFPTLEADAALTRGLRMWLDGLPDEETRQAACRLIAPFVRGVTPPREGK